LPCRIHSPVLEARKPKHPRINFRKDTSTSDATLAWLHFADQVRRERVMVTLDSAHTKDHVLAELERYGPIVSPGMYLMVEDSNIDHTFKLDTPEFQNGGPWHALESWLSNHFEFEHDMSREKSGLTLNPGGWLKRVR
jgi:cephalosporin hydroxylase